MNDAVLSCSGALRRRRSQLQRTERVPSLQYRIVKGNQRNNKICCSLQVAEDAITDRPIPMLPKRLGSVETSRVTTRAIKCILLNKSVRITACRPTLIVS